MPSTFDSLLRLELQAVGENSNTWGVKANTALELIANAISGHTSISVAGTGNFTLSTANGATDQARQSFLTLTGILTGARAIIIPSTSKIYYFRNATTGAFAITVKTAAGIAITIPQGSTAEVICDGLDCYDPAVNKVNKSGDTMTGALNIPTGLGTVAARALRSDEVDVRIAVAIPTGVIMLWSGSIASIPAGYALCNGTSGTPDLRDKFVVGAGSTYAVAATGGAVSGTTSSDGAHTHTGATGSHTLTTAQIPSHIHGVTDGQHAHTIAGSTISTWNGVNNDSTAGGTGGSFTAQSTNSAGANITINAAGGGTGHTHTISSDGAHTHTVATLPPYYALAYIMKT